MGTLDQLPMSCYRRGISCISWNWKSLHVHVRVARENGPLFAVATLDLRITQRLDTSLTGREEAFSFANTIWVYSSTDILPSVTNCVFLASPGEKATGGVDEKASQRPPDEQVSPTIEEVKGFAVEKHNSLASNNELEPAMFGKTGNAAVDRRPPTASERKTLRHVHGTIPWIAFVLCVVEFAERASYYGATQVFNNFMQYPLPPGKPSDDINSDFAKGYA
jgi:hypothetical protein